MKEQPKKIKLSKYCSICSMDKKRKPAVIGIIDFAKGGDRGSLCEAHLFMFCLQNIEKNTLLSKFSVKKQ